MRGEVWRPPPGAGSSPKVTRSHCCSSQSLNRQRHLDRMGLWTFETENKKHPLDILLLIGNMSLGTLTQLDSPLRPATHPFASKSVPYAHGSDSGRPSPVMSGTCCATKRATALAVGSCLSSTAQPQPRGGWLVSMY